MPSININELKESRKAFSKNEWINIMLRSIGMEPNRLTEREKWLLLIRLVPLVENNWIIRVPCPYCPDSGNRKSVFKETAIPVMETFIINS